MTDFASPPLARWRFTHLLWIGGLLFALLAAGLMAIGAIIALNDPQAAASGDVPLTLGFTLGATAVQALAFLLPVGLVGWWVGIDWRTAVGWRNPTAYWWGIALLLGLLCIPVTGLIATYTQELLAYEEIYNPQLDFVVPEGFSWLAFIGMTLTVGLLIPVAEELIFRGVLLTWLAAHVPGWAAVLVTSLIFAAMHVEPSIVAGTLFLGLVCGWLVQKSGSLWPAIAVHVLNNAVKVVILYLALLLDIPLV